MNNLMKTMEVLIDKSTVSILSSVDEAGFPNTKAMLPPRKRDGIKQFYFTTNTSSMRISQFIANSISCVYFYNGRLFQGVMFKGTMEVLHDAKSKELIWRAGDEMYYPAGVTDPDYSVLKFSAQNARFYGNFKSENVEL